MTDDERRAAHAVRGGFIEITTGVWVRLSAIYAIRPIAQGGGLDHGTYEAGARTVVHWRAASPDGGTLCCLTLDELLARIREGA